MTIAEQSWSTIDKSGWADGPWNDEPDKIQWIDEATGLDCLIHRSPLGALCGYVGVPPEHPWHGREYSSGGLDDRTAPESNVSVHGGLTYSDFCAEGLDESEGICHVPAPGRPANVYWFGFDCGHSGDLAPVMEARDREMGFDRPSVLGERSYKTVDYVKGEVASLAQQLVEIRHE